MQSTAVMPVPVVPSSPISTSSAINQPMIQSVDLTEASAVASAAYSAAFAITTSIELASATVTAAAAASAVKSPAAVIAGALSQSQIDEYLAKHNAVRQRYDVRQHLQSSALPEAIADPFGLLLQAVDLTWDATVASAAQSYAEKCTWGHSGNSLCVRLFHCNCQTG
jgi:uncharacterized protein YkwD